MLFLRVFFLTLLLGIPSVSQSKPEQRDGAKEPAPKLSELIKEVHEHPDSADAHYRLGQAYWRNGDDQQAVEEFNLAVTLKPDFAEAFAELGWAYFNFPKSSGNTSQQAVDAFSMAVRINPKLADAHKGLVMVYREEGKYREAVEAYIKAAELDPEGPLILSELQTLCEQLGRYDEAIQVAEHGITYHPTPSSHFILGDLYLKVNRPDEAIAAYRKGILRNQEIKDAWHLKDSMWNLLGWQRLGELYVHLGRYAEAVEPCQQELRDHPENPQAYLVLKDAYRKMGLTREAVKTARQMTEALPEDPVAAYELGSLYVEVGDKAAALAVQKRLAEMAERTKKAGAAESDTETYAKLLLYKINQ